MLCRLVISGVSGAFAAFIFRVVQEELDCPDIEGCLLLRNVAI